MSVTRIKQQTLLHRKENFSPTNTTETQNQIVLLQTLWTVCCFNTFLVNQPVVVVSSPQSFSLHCRGNFARIGSFYGNVSNQKSCMEALLICMAILFILFSRQHFDGIIDRCENFPMVALIYGRDCPECSHSRPFIRNNVLHFFSQTGMFILR